MLLRLHRKGVSEIVGYILLIVITLTLSAFVYAYLKFYVPKEVPECAEDTNIIVQDYICTINNSKLEIIVANKGLFKVYGMYVRLGDEGKRIRTQILGSSDNDFYFRESGKLGLLPGTSAVKKFNLADLGGVSIQPRKTYILEIQPAVFDSSNKLIACNKAVITKPIMCS